MNIYKTITIVSAILKLTSLGLLIYIFCSTSEELLNYFPDDFTQTVSKNFKINNLSEKIKCNMKKVYIKLNAEKNKKLKVV